MKYAMARCCASAKFTKETTMQIILHNLRYSLRQLFHSPEVTILAVVTLVPQRLAPTPPMFTVGTEAFSFAA